MSRPTRPTRPLRADNRYRAAKSSSSAEKTGKKPAMRAKKASGTASKRRPRTARRRRGGGGGIRGAFRGLVNWVFRLVWAVSWRFGAVLGLVIAGAVFMIYSTLPPADDLMDGRARGSVTLMDARGEVFAWRGDQFGGAITANTVSPYLKHAIVATEDRRFYKHFGVSPRGVASAIRINLSEGRSALQGHGGSTITQQTAKLLCLGRPYVPEDWKNEAAYEADCRRGSLGRKIREAIYALALEARYTKDEILTIYMNRAYLGAGARGFQAASQRYFGKSAADVNPSEAAMLAGLLVAPTRYAPTTNLQLSRDRADVIVGLMEREGYLNATEAAVAHANPAELSEAAEARAGGYFADWIMESAPSFLASETTEDVVIRTTFDKRLQRAAEEALAWVFENKVRGGSKAQAAIVVMDADGAVRAMVGGRKTKVAGEFNRATQALRQTGSAFKPFVYAAALDLGYSYNARVDDAPYTLNIPGSGPWSPKNYDRKYHGMVTLTEALSQSLNVPAVKVSEEVGRENVRRIASDFGLKSDLAAGPALALGASESTLLNMTAAYAGILNGGSSVTPYGLTELRLLGDSDPLIGKEGGIGERVISERAARQLVWMMYQVIESGTGRRAKLDGRPAAGKTGTTQAARDAWFVGFTGDYVAGVWMGYDDNTPLSGVTGGGLPAEIWHETMLRVHEGVPVSALPMDAPARAPDAVAEDGATPRNPSNPLNSVDRAVDKAVNRTERAINNVLRSIFGG
ncbi:MAG: PBP1A family penicillin-binding protein [Rhodobacteraceae bacterium]|nr:PBP1A family penicillin-binding protein [Paracoccaceae bacterium]